MIANAKVCIGSIYMLVILGLVMMMSYFDILMDLGVDILKRAIQRTYKVKHHCFMDRIPVCKTTPWVCAGPSLADGH